MEPAAETGDVAIIRDLITSYGGIEPSAFSALLVAALRRGDAALELVRLLEQEGSKVCSKEAYIEKH